MLLFYISISLLSCKNKIPSSDVFKCFYVLFEYLDTGRPVLVLTNGVLETEMKRILSFYQTEGYFQNSENKGLKVWLTTMYIGWKNNQTYHCDRKKIAQKFSEDERNALIKKVSDKTPTRKNT